MLFSFNCFESECQRIVEKFQSKDLLWDSLGFIRIPYARLEASFGIFYHFKDLWILNSGSLKFF